MLAARDDGLDWKALTEVVAAGLKDHLDAMAPVPQLGGQTSDLPASLLTTRTFIALELLSRFARELKRMRKVRGVLR